MEKEDDGDIKLNLDDLVRGEPEFNMSEAKMALARKILSALFALVFMSYFFSCIPDEYVTQRTIKLADAVFQSIVPIASMVIGYYFAKD